MSATTTTKEPFVVGTVTVTISVPGVVLTFVGMVALSSSGNPVELLAGKKELFSKYGNTVMLLSG